MGIFQKLRSFLYEIRCLCSPGQCFLAEMCWKDMSYQEKVTNLIQITQTTEASQQLFLNLRMHFLGRARSEDLVPRVLQWSRATAGGEFHLSNGNTGVPKPSSGRTETSREKDFQYENRP